MYKRQAIIPFEYVIDNLERGESINTRNEIEILSQDFVIQDGGNVSCNINIHIETNMYRNNNTNLINCVEEDGEREEPAVSYTHLDVYKRQGVGNAVAISSIISIAFCAITLIFLPQFLVMFGCTDTLR